MRSFYVISALTYYISKLIPKKKRRWIFGAWFGNAVSDNTKAFYDYIRTYHPEIECIWVATDPSKVNLPGCIVVKRNSLSSLKYIMTAKVAVMNQGFGDFAAYNFLGGSLKVQLWHGVAWKKIGRDGIPDLQGIYEKLYQLINHYDIYIAPSKRYGESVKTAFKTDDSHIVYIGQPRNEVLFSEGFKNKSRKYVENLIGISNTKIIAYMPTFRDKTTDVFSFHKIEDNQRFKELAEQYDFVIVEKLHYRSQQRKEGLNKQKIVYGMPDIDAVSLLGAADMLITDYSSCFFDYLILDRPIIHYVYDYNYYKEKDRGLYYDISEVAAGTIANNQEELIKAINDNLTIDNSGERRKHIHTQFITFESDDNCARIYKEIQKRI